MLTRLYRFVTIERVLVKYGLETLFLQDTPASPLQHVFALSPTRWQHRKKRAMPRGQRIRMALEELGPVFVKLGQMLSTRRDLLPEDIGEELALLQDKVAPFDSELARQTVEKALGGRVEDVFASFEREPMASASIAQVHGAVLHDSSRVVVKIVRPGIEALIDRDVGLMYMLAGLAARLLPDGKRLRPVEVVREYDQTIHDELDLVREATNAVVLANHFKDSSLLYIPGIHWDYTRPNVMVQERIEGIPIRDIASMQAIGVDMKKLAEHGVEIFYTQVFRHNFFHADMHPGNIFVSRESPEYPQYIAVDFGIVGSLTDEDQRYIGENLLAFFQRDYRKVAQLHVDSGWVPAHTRVSELESAIRAVCEPIFDKPLAEISFGNVLVQLFQTAQRFEMEVQPQLVLLQKTLLNIEGLGRQLYPELDLWATGKPFLQNWVLERRGPKAIVRQLVNEAPQILAALPHMPLLMKDYLQTQNRLARLGMSSNQLLQQASGRRPDRGLKYTIAGAAVLLSAALLAAAQLQSRGSVSIGATLLVLSGGLAMLWGLLR